jgi:hypothetical protein
MSRTRAPLPETIRRLVLAGVLASLCAGCWTTNGQAQNMTGQPSGSDSLGSDPGPDVPPDILRIPQFPVPPNSTVVLGDTVIIGDDEDWSGQVFLTAPYTVLQITQFYRAEMPKVGWAETAIVRSRRTSISYTRGNRVATLRLAPQRDDSKGTEIDLVISPIQVPAGRSQRAPAPAPAQPYPRQRQP